MDQTAEQESSSEATLSAAHQEYERIWNSLTQPSDSYLQREAALSAPPDRRDSYALQRLAMYEKVEEWLTRHTERIDVNLTAFRLKHSIRIEHFEPRPSEAGQRILRIREEMEAHQRYPDIDADPSELLAWRAEFARLTHGATQEDLFNADLVWGLVHGEIGFLSWPNEGLIFYLGGFYRPTETIPLWIRVHLGLYDDAPTQDKSVVAPSRRRDHLPALLPLSTFAEAKTVTIASADGRHGRRWIGIENEIALWHAAAIDAPLQVKFVASPLLDWLTPPVTNATLMAALKEMGLRANLAFYTCVNALLGPEPQTMINLDELITVTGMRPRSRTERSACRSQVWRWLAVFSCWHIIGLRKGRYTDRQTKQVLDLRSEAPLFHIDERLYPEGEQFTLDDSATPIGVTLVRGAWLSHWADDERIISYFGNVRRLADFPAGQTSGAWAQAIGMTLFQLWREASSRVEIVGVGDQQRPTARFAPFTRRGLLDTFLPDPTVEDILNGPNPKRARNYWTAAITLLKDGGIIGSYKELGTLPPDRQGWAKPWLDQKMDIRPSREGMQDVVLIANRAQAARKAAGHKRQTRGVTK